MRKFPVLLLCLGLASPAFGDFNGVAVVGTITSSTIAPGPAAVVNLDVTDTSTSPSTVFHFACREDEMAPGEYLDCLALVEDDCALVTGYALGGSGQVYGHRALAVEPAIGCGSGGPNLFGTFNEGTITGPDEANLVFQVNPFFSCEEATYACETVRLSGALYEDLWEKMTEGLCYQVDYHNEGLVKVVDEINEQEPRPCYPR